MNQEESRLISRIPPRLEQLLAFYEKNLQLEVFFISRNEIEKLLELLPVQGSLVKALTEELTTLKLPPVESKALQTRLEAADALRESSVKALDQAASDVKSELEEMNRARLRIKQARQLSVTMYKDSADASRLQDWA
jgi:hypothetical protein